MKTLSKALCTTLLTSLLAAQGAFAQPSGLRLEGGNRGIVLRDTENGLRLRFSSQATPSTSWWNGDATDQDSNRSTLSADWPLDMGLHTSLGLSWDTSHKNASGQSTNGTPSTFFGLGWASESSRSSRWALSAQVGTRFSASSACKSALSPCGNTPPLGLTGNAMGNGLRLSPYVSFGATYSFDR